MKAFALFFSFLLLLTLAGCGQSSAAPQPSPSSSSVTQGSQPGESSSEAQPQKQEAPPSSGGQETSTPASSSQGQDSLVGSYAPTTDVGYDLNLELRADNTYTLTVKVLMLSGEVTGTYSLSGEELTLQADKVSLPVYSGENVGALQLKVQADGSLYYASDDLSKQLGLDVSSITFTKRG